MQNANLSDSCPYELALWGKRAAINLAMGPIGWFLHSPCLFDSIWFE